MASVFSASLSEADSVGPTLHHEIIFPPDPDALQAIALACDRGLCPFKIGHNVSVDLFNMWLADSETGLRVDYDEVSQQVVIREACISSHGRTRSRVCELLDGLYLPHGYTSAMGQIITPAGRPNLSPDAFVKCRLPTHAKYHVIALEVGASQTAFELSTRAQTLLQDIPTLQFVILIKLHDDATAECRRLYAWTESRNPLGGAALHSPLPPLEFGPVMAGGAANPTYWPAGAGLAGRPFLPLPALAAAPGGIPAAVPSLNLDLGAVLEALRAADGANWDHYPPP